MTSDCTSTTVPKCKNSSKLHLRKRMVHQRHCPAGVRQTQELAMTMELYLVRQVGPTAWMVGTRGGDPYRVCVGQVHSCSCPSFRANRDICVHLAWILIKKLGLLTTKPLSYQLGMTERELNDCLYPPRREEMRVAKKSRVPKANKLIPVKRKKIEPGDTCPICLEEFSVKRSSVVFCKYSCGQVMHGRCMEVVAKHQEGLDLSCPLCRGHFSTILELRQAIRASILPPLAKMDPLKQGSVKKWNSSQKAEGKFNRKENPVHLRSKNQKRPKYLPKIDCELRGPAATLLDETSSMKCPICTDQGFSIVTLECGHLIPTPDLSRTTPEQEDEFKRPPRTPCGRLSRRGPVSRQFIPPPEVVVHRLQLAQREAPPSAASKPLARPKKKKEAAPEPPPPDPRENGRILGSKVLPLMALLLQRKADEDEDEAENEGPDEIKPPEKPSQDEKNGKRKLTIQCVQLLPDAEAMPIKPGSSRHFCHR